MEPNLIPGKHVYTELDRLLHACTKRKYVTYIMIKVKSSKYINQ